MERRLMDLLPNRRDALKWGGIALTGTCLDRVVWPLKVSAAGKTNPRGVARNIIFIDMGGAITQMDCFDFHETHTTPKDLDVRKVNSELYLSKTLFPNLIDHIDKVALVRSMRAIGLLHFNGQYHTQAGRTLNVAIAKEIPAWGSVIAYELQSQRRETDTFPTYIGSYVAKNRAGVLSAGFLPPQFTVMDLDPMSVFNVFGGNSGGVDRLLEERWKILSSYSELVESTRTEMGKKAEDYRVFYHDAYKVIGDPRWSNVFNVTDEDRQRYGDDEYGRGVIVARNLIKADAGTRVVYVYDGDRWDQHEQIFDRRAKLNHYVNCLRFEKAYVSLLTDLQASPGHAPGKTLLDETMIVATSEFGRTPKMNPAFGRDHWRFVYTSLFAGAGVKGGRIIGKSDAEGAYCVDPGWQHKEQPWMDNIVATMYSALGIDWRKRIDNTPSGRTYEYVQTAPLGGSEFQSDDEIAEVFA
jgi:hypothetical protein